MRKKLCASLHVAMSHKSSRKPSGRGELAKSWRGKNEEQLKEEGDGTSGLLDAVNLPQITCI